MQDHSHVHMVACWDEKLQVVEGGRAKTPSELQRLGKQRRLLLSPFLSQFYSAILLVRF